MLLFTGPVVEADEGAVEVRRIVVSNNSDQCFMESAEMIRSLGAVWQLKESLFPTANSVID